MQNAANLPTHVPTLHHLLIEQQHMINHLQEQLRLALRRQFGPRNEYVNVDQLGLFAGDNSTVIETAITEAEDTSSGDVTNHPRVVARRLHRSSVVKRFAHRRICHAKFV